MREKKKKRAEILIRNTTGKLVKSTYGVSYYDGVGVNTGVLYRVRGIPQQNGRDTEYLSHEFVACREEAFFFLFLTTKLLP